jgi:hypothetical protein
MINMQPMPNLTNIVSLNPTHGEVYSIQYNVVKVVSDLQQVCVFSCSSCFRHQQYWLPRYSWNIVESGVVHHNPKSNPNTNSFVIQFSNKIQLFTDKIK